jgi:glycosyltransferase involved in cell wall biosynthesis
MRVLFACPPHIGLSIGGLRRQIDLTAQALSDLGVQVDLLDIWRNQIDQTDLLHLFSTSASMYEHVRYAQAKGKPVVLSAVLNVFDKPLWLYVLSMRCLSRLPMVGGLQRITRSLVHAADRIILLQIAEGRALKAMFGVPSKRMLVIPNGIDKNFAQATPDLFVQRYGLRDFALNVAYIGRTKNQLNLVRAVKGTNRQVVVVGAPLDGGQAYLDQCKREASGNVHFIGTFPFGDPILRSAYAAARVFVLPSYSEVMPISLMEAALAGCRLVGSSRYPIQPALKPYVSTPDPDRPEQIREALEQAYLKSDTAREAMMAEPDWLEVGRRILAVYEELLSGQSTASPLSAGANKRST